MGKKPTGNFWNILIQTVFVVSSIIFYDRVKPTANKISVTIVSSIFKILGLGGIAKMLKPDKNPSHELDDDEFDNEELEEDSLFLD